MVIYILALDPFLSVAVGVPIGRARKHGPGEGSGVAGHREGAARRGCGPVGGAERSPAVTGPIHVLNGPNLNRLGKREPEIYGHTTLPEVEVMCREAAGDIPIVFRQTNWEGQLVDWIHEATDGDAA